MKKSLAVLFALALLLVLVLRWPTVSPAPAPTPAAAPAPQVAAAPVEKTPEPATAPVRQTVPQAMREIGGGWRSTTHDSYAAFREWTERYLAAAPGDRAALVEEGRALARARRAELAALIRRDPRRALELAVPMVVRQQLPAALVAELEERVSGEGELALLAVTPAPGQRVEEPLFRSARVDGREYRAHVYGRRDRWETIPRTAMVGIAIDHDFAVAESPLRVLEPGELAAGRPVEAICVTGDAPAPVVAADRPFNLGGPLAVEALGQICVLCNPTEAAKFKEQLIASEGTRLENLADNQPGTSGVTNRPSQAWTHGTKKVLVVVVDFPDFPGRPNYPFGNPAPALTDDFIVNVMNGTNGVTAYFARNSFGKTALQIADPVAGDSVDVTPVLRLPRSAVYYATGSDPSVAPYSAKNGELHADATAAATAAGYNTAAYDRIGVVFRNIGGSVVPNSQITYGGLGNLTGTNFWVNGYWDFRVVGHEIGHNYGLAHSNLWKVTDGNPISDSGSTFEYGDEFDLMGEGDTPEFDFSHWNKSLLQWIPDTGVTTIETSGTYRVYRFDDSGANLTLSRALKIVRDNQRDYWIGYRRGTNYATADNGAYVLWGYNSRQQGNLLDMNTPGTNTFDAPLALNQTFSDSTFGITLRPIAQGGSGADEYLDVQVTLTAQFNLTRTSVSVGEGEGSVTFTVTRTRDSAGAISVNYATASGTATSGADFTATSGTLSWAAGDSTSRTLTIPITADAVSETSENFTVTLSSPTNAVLGSNAAATVTIFDAGVRDPGFTAEFINNQVRDLLALPDGSVVIAGDFGQVQKADFSLYSRGGITKVDSTGLVDINFAAGGGVTGGTITEIIGLPDGKMLISGSFTAVHGVARNRIARLNADGSLDSGFPAGTGPDNNVNAIVALPDGKFLVGGRFTTWDGTARAAIARLNADGTLDTTFTGPTFASTSRVESIAVLPDGRILIAGSFYFLESTFKSGLARLNANGSRDTTFTGITNGAHSVGSTNSFSAINVVTVQPDGKIWIGGSFGNYNNATPVRSCVARLNADGSVDSSVDLQIASGSTVNAITYLPGGQVLLGGSFTSVQGTTVANLALISASGTVDTAFAAKGGVGGPVYEFALQPEGRVVMGSSFQNFQGSTAGRPIWRFAGPVAGQFGTVQLTGTSASGNEGSSAQLTVRRTGAGVGALTVGYSTIAGTATSADFTPTSGTLTWNDGDLADKTITVPLTADSVTDPGESFTVRLAAPLIGGIVLGANQQSSVTVGDVAGYAAWAATRFTTGELADNAVSGLTADPDADGYSNLVEYALGLEPKTPNGGAVTTVAATGGEWVYTYTRPSARSDLTYAVEFSTTLTSWTTTGVTHELVSTTSGVETWRARVSATGVPTAFFRLRVTR